MKEKTERIFKNLLAQIERISKHARQGSFKTRERYKGAVIRFIMFLAEVFKLQKFANVQDKHISAYIKHMQDKGLSASTIKTDLAAIRYFHDQCPEAKYVISDNGAFELEKRLFGGVDRTWSQIEFTGMVNIAWELGQTRIVYVLCLGRYQGLRIHEALRLDRAAAESALKAGILHVKGKNGKERDVLLRSQIRRVFHILLEEVSRGEKLFILPSEKTHLVIKQIQNFIVRHRHKVAASGRVTNMTFHGLRHTFAAEEYSKRIAAGMSEYKARKEVAKILGHDRDDVTDIYTTSVVKRTQCVRGGVAKLYISPTEEGGSNENDR
ncbi:tyrosine-type recombinase/integrase [Lutispora sp.]|uniref:tyrosine-type recombinase/integrase n=1 Tax=Lutispora sp. TaxID=2828727 RepID=UPI003568AB05